MDDEVKEFLLDYRYILFDTREWDFRDERNEELRNNVFLLTAMAVMKYAYTEDDVETIEEIVKFWNEKGFTKDIESVVFFLTYISETKNISRAQLKEILEKSKIDGGEIMETLAQQLREEGRKIGVEEGLKEGLEEGKKEGKLETARGLIKNGIDFEVIARATGFSREEIEKLATSTY